ncbi:NAD(P)-binding protein [Xylariomycetidae sp. FL2044]|nr:NAD(P)-binding protein [Xylariomycetidae sp. FL2044]
MSTTTPHPLSAAALFDLKGRVAVVTGGGTGVGLMIAQTLAANGARVYITGRRPDVLDTSARVHGSGDRLGSGLAAGGGGGGGGSFVPLVMDVTSKESIQGAVAEIGKREGWVDILVNNAGIWTHRPDVTPADGPEAFGKGMFDEDVEEHWQNSFLSNSTSLYFVTAAFLPLLAKAASGPAGKPGCVINNSSAASLMRMSQNRQFSYNASKAAATHLSRQLAFELSHETIRVRVNTLALGYFPSEMTTGTSNEENESVAADDKFAKFMASMGVPHVKRMGTPQELASAVLTLVTNDYIWGTVTIVDGGLALTSAGNM